MFVSASRTGRLHYTHHVISYCVGWGRPLLKADEFNRQRVGLVDLGLEGFGGVGGHLGRGQLGLESRDDDLFDHLLDLLRGAESLKPKYFQLVGGQLTLDELLKLGDLPGDQFVIGAGVGHQPGGLLTSADRRWIGVVANPGPAHPLSIVDGRESDVAGLRPAIGTLASVDYHHGHLGSAPNVSADNVSDLCLCHCQFSFVPHLKRRVYGSGGFGCLGNFLKYIINK